MIELTWGIWAVASVATLIFGVSKTALPPIGILGVATAALVLPAVPSAGIVLPVLIVGDLCALLLYARRADWRILLGLLPTVVVGLGLGFACLEFLTPTQGARVIGALLVVSGAGEALRRWLVGRRGVEAPTAPGGGFRVIQWLLGVVAGFSTMVANAGGPAMSLYLSRARLPALTFLGTSAWYFFVINVVKVPFSVGLGLISAHSLVISAALLPGLLVGALIGSRIAGRIPQRAFDAIVLVGTTLAGFWLLLR